MPQINFSETLKRAPDEELLRIAASGEDGEYVVEAIAAAKRELKLRGRSLSSIIEPSSVDRQDIEELKGERATTPLSYLGWIMFLIFGVLIAISLLIIVTLFLKGYTQKGNDALLAMALSVGLWFAGFFILGYFL